MESKDNKTTTDNMYELTVLINPDNDNQKAIEKITKIIEDNAGTIIKYENDGVKRLAYEICGKEFANYNFFEIAGGDRIAICNTLNITEEVLRYLMVTANKKY